MNPIQPITSRQPEISVTAPINLALERVKQVLFRPFDLGKWFVIGFCVWLAQLGEQGGGSGYYNFGNHNRSGGIKRQFESAKDYVMDNLHWIVPVVVVAVLVVLALWVLFVWLSSRGKFMFLHCVALNRAEVAVPWQKYAREADSLWLFRLGLGVVGSLVMLPLAGLIAVLVIGMVNAGAANAFGVTVCAVTLLLLILLGLVYFVIDKLTKDFVVPIMYRHGGKCLESWRELRKLMSGNIPNLILYFLFQLVLVMVIGTILFIVVLATCCVAGCLMALPYLGTVLLLPVLMFSRAYSLYYLAQFRPDFDVFTGGEVATTAPAV